MQSTWQKVRRLFSGSSAKSKSNRKSWRLGVESLERRELLASVAVFSQTSYTYQFEKNIVVDVLQRSGHEITEFSASTGTDMEAALLNKDVLVIPYQSRDITQFTTPEAELAIRNFAASGRTVIVQGDFVDQDVSTLNNLFFIHSLRNQSGIVELVPTLTTQGSSTIFSQITQPLQWNRLTLLDRAFLPANATSVYEYSHSGGFVGSALTVFPYEAGNVIYFGAYFFNSTAYASWNETLHLATQVNKFSNALVTPNLRTTPVESIDIEFKYPIDAATFTKEDLSLSLNHIGYPTTDDVSIEQVQGNLFRIHGLTNYTSGEGIHRLDINTQTVNYADGAPLSTNPASLRVTWKVDATGPTLKQIQDIPAIIEYPFQAVQQIEVEFSESIDSTTFTKDDLALSVNGTPLNLAPLAIFPLSGSKYRVSGLGNITKPRGNYEFKILGEVTDISGNTSSLSGSEIWKRNDKPYLSPINGSVIYREGNTPRVIAPAVLVNDPESTDLENGRLTVNITQNARAEDELSIRHQGTGPNQIGVSGNTVSFGGVEVGTFTGGVRFTNGKFTPLVITFGLTSSPAIAQAIMRNIHFRTVTENPSTLPRSVSFQLTDGDGGTSLTQVKTVEVRAVNTPPKLELGLTTRPYKIGAAAIQLAPNATLLDPDTPDFTNGSLTVRIGSGRDILDRFSIGGAFTTIGTQLFYDGFEIGTIKTNFEDTTELSIQFNSQARIGFVERLIRQIRFSTTHSSNKRGVEFILADGAGGITTSTLSVNVYLSE